MRIKDLILLLAILYSYSAYTQNMVEYTSGWEGKIENSKTFNLKIEIENLGLEKARFKIFNRTNIIDYPFNIKSASLIEIPFSENYSFKGILSKSGKEINGFIKSGILLYHLKLIKSDNNTFVGIWNILMVDELKSLNFLEVSS